MSYVELFETVIAGDFTSTDVMAFTATTFFAQFFRFFIACLVPFFIIFRFGKSFFHKYRMQEKPVEKARILYEVKYSLWTMLLFFLTNFLVLYLVKVGYFKIYTDFSEKGLGYFVLTCFYIVFVHDAFFYWTHRLLHTKWLFKKVHYVHHRNRDTNPITAFCFHPIETLIQVSAAVVLFGIIPLHPFAILFFNLWWTSMDIYGHVGHEFFPKFWRKKGVNLWASSAYHNLHHSKVTSNFGLYFTFWDRLMGTTDFKSYLKVLDRHADKISKDDREEISLDSKAFS